MLGLGKRQACSNEEEGGAVKLVCNAAREIKSSRDEEVAEESRRGAATLSDDLLVRVFGFLDELTTLRSLSKNLAFLGERCFTRIKFHPETPSSTITSLLMRMPCLCQLDMSNVKSADDYIIRTVVEHCPSLIHLNISYCTELTTACLPWLMMVPDIDVRGCWRLLQPSPSLPSTTVLELQLLALQQNRVGVNDGLQKQYDFASPANRSIASTPEEFCRLFHSRFHPLINCQAFSVRQLCFDPPHSACFLVRTITTGGKTIDYLWILSRQEDKCWMTDAVLVVEHGLLSAIATGA